MALELEGVRWLFFDLGYTLINEDAAAMGRLSQASDALKQRGIDASTDKLHDALEAASARFDPSPFGNVLQAFTDDEDVIAFVRSSGRYPKELEAPYPQAQRLLARLEGRYQLGIIANQPPGTAERLQAYGLSGYFEVCVSSGDIGISKPDAAIFHLALEQAECAPGDAVMVGDRLDNDIRPAKSARLPHGANPSGARTVAAASVRMGRRRTPRLRIWTNLQPCSMLMLAGDEAD
ncbi:Glyceraldehyde 3-phosphate phosphatase [Geodia barretti]|uniref:Glyceraldehyde 3-phosphate phosphatase n=1 Tax=Geodia barretti TaxID=519541 RepID=A0AA35QW67_GEOBA|nr:Glyceraldehyde 3-phosphate phosphatase [Geodia barretti]